MRLLACILALGLLAACGTKTPLTLPPKPATTAPAAPTPATPADDSKERR